MKFYSHSILRTTVYHIPVTLNNIKILTMSTILWNQSADLLSLLASFSDSRIRSGHPPDIPFRDLIESTMEKQHKKCKVLRQLRWTQNGLFTTLDHFQWIIWVHSATIRKHIQAFSTLLSKNLKNQSFTIFYLVKQRPISVGKCWTERKEVEEKNEMRQWVLK